MPNKMLIDASHPEETRVVVVRGNRIEEFDFESQDKKQLKGNIYLARVTRVEPSLQAAFVEYGGNRHGFLAFSEIHPDYYQIPVADRQALLRAEAEDAEEDDEDDGESAERGRSRRRRRGSRSRRGGEEHAAADSSDSETATGEPAGADVDAAADPGSTEAASFEDGAEAAGRHADEPDAEDTAGSEAPAAASDAADAEPPAAQAADGDDATRDATDDEPDSTDGPSMAAAIDGDLISELPAAADPDGAEEKSLADVEPAGDGLVEDAPAGNGDEHEVESVGAEDALEEVRNRRKPVRRHYKIQEVIKRRQILLVQVVKEERGNKGAALTTYLSLAGRYSVLMPNTARGGGISRKITNAQDRKRLKEVVQELEVPQGMGVILRTAGESRTKAEIKRDYEYLMRMWENVRNLTLQSSAPALVYEEGSLIKRSVRDLYNKDIDEILVAGEDGYREAKDFMRMLMPSHAKVVQPYRETVPIFARAGIEAQLDKMLQPQVTLKSGGYIIINQTEALVAIDVNSGRSTREHSIEDTALQTNLEAAEEIARQLRLRDLAGLIVIDFIDMEENRNNRAVEKRVKEHLKNDRARIQVGRISHFGLMEMSRQRIRASVLESTMKPCPHCGGTGHVRSESSVALLVVRAIEEFLLKDSRQHISVKTPVSTALYVLNHKRGTLADLERRFGLTITIDADDSIGSQHYAIFRGAPVERPVVAADAVVAPAAFDESDDDVIEEAVPEEAAEAAPGARAEEADGEGNRDRKRRRRRRRRGGRDREAFGHEGGANGEQSAGAAGDDEDAESAAEDDSPEAAEEPAVVADAEGAGAEAAADEADRKKRRRGKRGGKRNRRDETTSADGEDLTASADAAEGDASVTEGGAPDADEASQEPVAAPAIALEEPAEVPAAPAVAVDLAETAPAEADADAGRPRVSRRRTDAATDTVEPVVSSSDEAPAEERPRRTGWWQRKGGFF